MRTVETYIERRWDHRGAEGELHIVGIVSAKRRPNFDAKRNALCDADTSPGAVVETPQAFHLLAEGKGCKKCGERYNELSVQGASGADAEA